MQTLKRDRDRDSKLQPQNARVESKYVPRNKILIDNSVRVLDVENMQNSNDIKDLLISNGNMNSNLGLSPIKKQLVRKISDSAVLQINNEINVSLDSNVEDGSVNAGKRGGEYRCESLPHALRTVQVSSRGRYLSVTSRPLSDGGENLDIPRMEQQVTSNLQAQLNSLLNTSAVDAMEPITPDRKMSREEMIYQQELSETLWLEIRAWHALVDCRMYDNIIYQRREMCHSVASDVMSFRRPCSDDRRCRCLSIWCRLCRRETDRSLVAARNLLRRCDEVDSLFPSHAKLVALYPEWSHRELVARVGTIRLWYNTTKRLRRTIVLLGKRLRHIANTNIPWPDFVPVGKDMKNINVFESLHQNIDNKANINSRDSVSPENNNSCNGCVLDTEKDFYAVSSVYSTPSISVHLSQDSDEEFNENAEDLPYDKDAKDSVNSNNVFITNVKGTDSNKTNDKHDLLNVNSSDGSNLKRSSSAVFLVDNPYRKYVEKCMHSRGLKKTFEKIFEVVKDDMTRTVCFMDPNHSHPDNLSRALQEHCYELRRSLDHDYLNANSGSDDTLADQTFNDNIKIAHLCWSGRMQRLGLSGTSCLFYFLASVPVRLVCECLRLRLSQMPSQPSTLSVTQLVREYRESLRLGVAVRRKFGRWIAAVATHLNLRHQSRSNDDGNEVRLQKPSVDDILNDNNLAKQGTPRSKTGANTLNEIETLSKEKNGGSLYLCLPDMLAQSTSSKNLNSTQSKDVLTPSQFKPFDLPPALSPLKPRVPNHFNVSNDEESGNSSSVKTGNIVPEDCESNINLNSPRDKTITTPPLKSNLERIESLQPYHTCLTPDEGVLSSCGEAELGKRCGDLLEDLDANMETMLRVYLDWLDLYFNVAGQESNNQVGELVMREWRFVLSISSQVLHAYALSSVRFVNITEMLISSAWDSLGNGIDELTSSLQQNKPRINMGGRGSMGRPEVRRLSSVVTFSKQRLCRALVLAKCLRDQLELAIQFKIVRSKCQDLNGSAHDKKMDDMYQLYEELHATKHVRLRSIDQRYDMFVSADLSQTCHHAIITNLLSLSPSAQNQERMSTSSEEQGSASSPNLPSLMITTPSRSNLILLHGTEDTSYCDATNMKPVNTASENLTLPCSDCKNYVLLVRKNNKFHINEDPWNGDDITIQPTAGITIALSSIIDSEVVAICGNGCVAAVRCHLTHNLTCLFPVSERVVPHTAVNCAMVALKRLSVEVCARLMHCLRIVDQLLCTERYPKDHNHNTTRDKLHGLYKLAFEYNREVSRLVWGGPESSRMVGHLVELGRAWANFCVTHYRSGKGMKPRWASQGLDFLLFTCSPEHMKLISSDLARVLEQEVIACFSHIIGTPQPSTSTPQTLRRLDLRKSFTNSANSTPSLSDSIPNSPPVRSISNPMEENTPDYASQTVSESESRILFESKSLQRIRRAIAKLDSSLSKQSDRRLGRLEQYAVICFIIGVDKSLS